MTRSYTLFIGGNEISGLPCVPCEIPDISDAGSRRIPSGEGGGTGHDHETRVGHPTGGPIVPGPVRNAHIGFGVRPETA